MSKRRRKEPQSERIKLDSQYKQKELSERRRALKNAMNLQKKEESCIEEKYEMLIHQRRMEIKILEQKEEEEIQESERKNAKSIGKIKSDIYGLQKEIESKTDQLFCKSCDEASPTDKMTTCQYCECYLCVLCFQSYACDMNVKCAGINKFGHKVDSICEECLENCDFDECHHCQLYLCRRCYGSHIAECERVNLRDKLRAYAESFM